MNLTPELKDTIQALYDGTPEYVHGVTLAHKYTGGQKTEKISIVFLVDKKLPVSEVPAGEMLPASLVIDGVTVETDVQEAIRAHLVTCYGAGNQNIARLQPAQSGASFLTPMRGGQEIIQFPTGWTAVQGGYNITLGTLGFFCVDNADNKIVGVTNAHVTVSKRQFCSERALDDYNTYDERVWIADNIKYTPGAGRFNTGAFAPVASRVKRYTGATASGTNYVDGALLMMDPNVISTDSYKLWGPIEDGDDPGPFTSPMPFATTAEIDALLTSYPRCFSTGRTTGPKGFTDSASCRLRVIGVGTSLSVGDPDIGTLAYSDALVYAYEDGSANPCVSGDSGSCLVALIGGVYKIIGLVFAGGAIGDGTPMGVACRIDRVAQELNIRAWDGTFNTNTFDAVTYRGDDALGELLVAKNDPRAEQTSFVHTDGFTYWQAGFRLTAGNSSASAVGTSSSTVAASSGTSSTSTVVVGSSSSNRSSSSAVAVSSSSVAGTSSSGSTDIVCALCANFYNVEPQYVTDQNGYPGISFSSIGDPWNGCPEYGLLLPQLKRAGGEWLYLVPRNTQDNAVVNGILSGSNGVYGALGTIEWNGTNAINGQPITDRSLLSGYRWRFVEYVQADTAYSVRGTAYKLGQDVLATLCTSDGVTPSSNSSGSTGSGPWYSHQTTLSSSSGATTVALACAAAEPACLKYKWLEECEYFAGPTTPEITNTDRVFNNELTLYSGQYFRFYWLKTTGSSSQSSGSSSSATVDDTDVYIQFAGPCGTINVPLADVSTIPQDAPPEIDIAYEPFDNCEYNGADRQIGLNGLYASGRIGVAYWTREWLSNLIASSCPGGILDPTPVDVGVLRGANAPLLLASCFISPDATTPAYTNPPSLSSLCPVWIGPDPDNPAAPLYIYIPYDREVEIIASGFPIVCRAWVAASDLSGATGNSSSSSTSGASEATIGVIGRAETFVSRCVQINAAGRNELPQVLSTANGCVGYDEVGVGPWRTELFCEYCARNKTTLMNPGPSLASNWDTTLIPDDSDSEIGPRLLVNTPNNPYGGGENGTRTITVSFYAESFGGVSVPDNAAYTQFIDSEAVSVCPQNGDPCRLIVQWLADKITYEDANSPGGIDRIDCVVTRAYSCEAWDPVNHVIVEPQLSPPTQISWNLIEGPDKCNLIGISVADPGFNGFLPWDLNRVDDVEMALVAQGTTLTNKLPLADYGQQLLAQTNTTKDPCFLTAYWPVNIANVRDAVAPACVVKVAVRRVKRCIFSGFFADDKRYYSDWAYLNVPVCRHFTCATDCSNITTDEERLDGGRWRGCTLESTAANPPTSYPTEETCFAGCGANFKCDSTLRAVYEIRSVLDRGRPRPVRVLVGYTVSGLCWKYAGNPNPNGNPPSYADNSGCQTRCCKCNNGQTPYTISLCTCSSSSSSSMSSGSSGSSGSMSSGSSGSSGSGSDCCVRLSLPTFSSEAEALAYCANTNLNTQRCEVRQESPGEWAAYGCPCCSDPTETVVDGECVKCCRYVSTTGVGGYVWAFAGTCADCSEFTCTAPADVSPPPTGLNQKTSRACPTQGGAGAGQGASASNTSSATAASSDNAMTSSSAAQMAASSSDNVMASSSDNAMASSSGGGESSASGGSDAAGSSDNNGTSSDSSG